MSASTTQVFAIVTTLLLAACSNGNGGYSDGGRWAVDQPKAEQQSTSAAGSASVSLSAVDNVYGIANSGAPANGGGLDGLGNAYAGALLGTSLSWAGTSFTIG